LNTKLSKIVAAAFLFVIIPFVGAAFSSGDHGDDQMKEKSSGDMKKKGGGHWAYQGDGGPAYWGDLDARFKTCKNGMSQSPIDVTFARNADLSGILVNYNSVPLEILNNGHTIQVNIAKGSKIEVERVEYDLLQFHFHSPSEHKVNGKAYDLVAHFVHKENNGEALAVMSVLFEEGTTNAGLKGFWKYLPKKAGEKHVVAKVSVDAVKILPSDRSYYHYSGSLTTPPCSEGVKWMLLKDPVQISKAQLVAFKAIIDGNVRPLQPLNSRIIEAKK